MKKYLSLIALLIFPFTFLTAESPKTIKDRSVRETREDAQEELLVK